MKLTFLFLLLLGTFSFSQQEKFEFNHMISYQYKPNGSNSKSLNRAYVYINSNDNNYFLSATDIGNNKLSLFFKHKKGFVQRGTIEANTFFKGSALVFNNYEHSSFLLKKKWLPYKTKLKKEADTIIANKKLKHLVLSSFRKETGSKYSTKTHYLINKKNKKLFTNYSVYSSLPAWNSEHMAPIGDFHDVYITDKTSKRILGRFVITHHQNEKKTIIFKNKGTKKASY